MVYSQGPTVTVTGHSPFSGTDPTPATDQHALFWQTWNCKLWLEGTAEELRQAILLGRVVAVSDGSFQDTAGAAAWTIEGTTAIHHLWGEGQTPANDDDHSAYQSELFRLSWGIMYTLLRFTKDYNLTKGKITIACNGASALRKAHSILMMDPNEAHYDIISAIRELRMLLPIQVTLEHVKSHQDNGQITALP